MAATTWFIFASILASGLAEIQVATITDCEKISKEVCTVNEVKVDVYRLGSNSILKKGRNASMVVDFTPNFSTSQLKIGLYLENPVGDILFDALETDDGCTYTGCPTTAGKTQLLNYAVHLGTKLPKGTFPMKWKVWNPNDETQACCFVTRVQLIK